MKNLILATMFSLTSTSGFAGFLPITSCSNVGAYISIIDNPNSYERTVTILTTKFPTTEYKTFDFKKLKLTETLLQTTPTKTKGTSSTTVTFKEITLEKADGSRMPDAYNKNAEDDGALVDYFICDTSQVFWPQPPNT